MKRFLLIASLFLMAGCRPFWLNFVEPAGPPEYKLGWEDGCDSGLSAQGGWDYKLMYGFKKRPELADNEQYKTGWSNAFYYCAYSLQQSSKPGSFEEIGLGKGIGY